MVTCVADEWLSSTEPGLQADSLKWYLPHSVIFSPFIIVFLGFFVSRLYVGSLGKDFGEIPNSNLFCYFLVQPVKRKFKSLFFFIYLLFDSGFVFLDSGGRTYL